MNTNARRFYETVSVVEADGGFSIALDTRRVRTPGGAHFVAPTKALAEACAQEWAAQEANIVPAAMPVTQLAFAAIDWTRPAREERADFVASYVQTDMCCYRASAPRELVERQERAWQPAVDWAQEALGLKLPVIVGVSPAEAPPSARASVRDQALAFDDFRLTALTQATAISGSLILGFALTQGRLNAEEVYLASVLDELWALERWGDDEEARVRLERIRAELDALARFLKALA